MAAPCRCFRAVLALALASAGCTADLELEPPARRGSPSAPQTPQANRDVSLWTWNLEWFQDPARGPADDVQFESARAVLAAACFDLAGLQEIAVPARLFELVAGLPDHAVVTSGHDWPQQTALVYRESRFELLRAGMVHGLDDAGRPPLEAELRTEAGELLRVLVVHAKAGADAASRARRERFAASLRAYLDASGGPVIVLGDFNDRFSGSIVTGAPSPYAVFGPASGYDAPTAVLEAGDEPSTVWGDVVDHIVLSVDLAARVRPGSAEVLRDELLGPDPDFFERVSDHVPVTLRILARASGRGRHAP